MNRPTAHSLNGQIPHKLLQNRIVDLIKRQFNRADAEPPKERCREEESKRNKNHGKPQCF